VSNLIRILVYMPIVTNRHRYVLGFLADYFEHRAVVEWTNIPGEILPGEMGINYSNEQHPGYLLMPPSGILEMTGCDEFQVNTGHHEGTWVLFPTNNPDAGLPFDLLGALFYLLSRYEEYQNYVPDHHGRYPHTQSILYIEKTLEVPVADIWLGWLEQQSPIVIPKRTPTLELTMDVDHPFRVYGKSFIRKTASYIKGLGRGELVPRRYSAENDPFNTLDQFREICHRVGASSIVFFLVNNKGKNNGTTAIKDPGYSSMIKKASVRGNIGLHTGYDTSGDSLQIAAEKTILEDVTEKNATRVRQHFLRFSLPQFYRNLCQLGFEEDHSMGYAATPGYRAGTSIPFKWYDLLREEATTLRVYPFCWMDATFTYYGGGESRGDTEETVGKYFKHIRRFHADHRGIVHNDHLSGDNAFAPWETILNRIFCG